jgi:alcohol dehydrogenase class IV
MERFQIRPEICFGADALEALDRIGDGRVLVVTDAGLAASGLLERVRARLTGPVEVFDQVRPDPTLELVAQGVEVFRAFRPEAVVAFGGGSPMDCGKAILHFALAQGEARPPFYAIPTTAGTGSEVTSFAVLTHQGEKFPLVDDRLLPDVAVLDPAFLAGVPTKVTADTGMDVLAHVLEAWVAAGANEFTDALALRGFQLAWENLPAGAAGDETAKGKLLLASCMAGMAFQNAGLGACHALSHALGGRFHVAHGRLNGVLLPAVMAFNGADGESARKYGQLARACGLSGTTRALISGLSRLRTKLEMPDTLTAAGIPREELERSMDQVCRAALADRCMAGNPRRMEPGDVEHLLREVM